MSAGKIALLVVGGLLGLLALGLAAGGGAALWVDQAKTDEDGFFTTSAEPFATPTYALASESLDVGGDGADWLFEEGRLARIRLTATSIAPDKEVFVGIAATTDVDAYLGSVEHEQVTDVDYDPFRVETRPIEGSAPSEAPAEAGFWVASASGPGTQALEWDVDEGTWSVVVMNADASRPVAVDLAVAARVGFLLPLAIGLLVAGLLLAALAALLIYLGVRRAGPPPLGEGAAVASAAPVPAAVAADGEPDDAVQPYPVAVEGELDPGLTRWQWLVKWILVIPHLLVLAVLWLAFLVLTTFALFAILVTGRYPRGIFDFNVGVLRWTWRVAFYSYGALATDRYPPFAFEETDYPARLDIPYPEQLSRGLALVKWWLLAIPHYAVLSVLTGGWTWGNWDDERWRWGWSGGLLGLLVFYAAVVLLVKGRYPRSLFTLVMGINRWTYRVIAYAALMRDEYPPFRLGR